MCLDGDVNIPVRQPSIRYGVSNTKTAYKVPTSKTLMSRIMLELLVLTILGYPMVHVYVFLQGDVEPYGRGFFCDDENLKHPFKEEEISNSECVAIWFGIVIVILPLIEGLHFAIFEYNEWEVEMKTRNVKGILGCFSRIPTIVIELYRLLGYFFVGALGCLLTVELAKYKIGRLRPYYLTVCNINLTKEICEDDFGYKKFVLPPHNCTGPQHILREAKISFMSGHSSFSFYCATFLVIYLHARLSQPSHPIPSHCSTKKNNKRIFKIIFRALRILRPFLQFLIYALAIYVALTRISDYRHHPSDVITGVIVGNLFAFLILLFMVDLFRRPRSFFDAKYTVSDNVIEEGRPDTPKDAYDVDGGKERS